MIYYAEVINGIVNRVIVADADYIAILPNSSDWIQTDENTRGNIHYAEGTNTPDGEKPLRGNYAGIGYIYDSVNDVFYPPQPYPSWVLNKATWTWQAPIKKPLGIVGQYFWNEPTQSWIKQIVIPTNTIALSAIPTTVKPGSSFVEIISVSMSGTSVIYQDDINPNYPFTEFVPQNWVKIPICPPPNSNAIII
jgi:hypothetical protein